MSIKEGNTESPAQRTLDDGGIACRATNTSLLSHCYMALPKLNHDSDILEAMVALATVGTPMSEALEKPLQVIRDKHSPYSAGAASTFCSSSCPAAFSLL